MNIMFIYIYNHINKQVWGYLWEDEKINSRLFVVCLCVLFRNMGRKGKEHVGSSSQQEDPQAKCRRRLGENVVDPKPKWDSGLSDEQPKRWQPVLFHEQMNRLKDMPATFICEKEVREVDFGPFNVINRFKTLGWEAALNYYDKDSKNLFMEEIKEWMATLRCLKYNKPQQMKLIGTVNNIDVEMLFDTLRRLAKFDCKPAREYMFSSLDNLYHNPEAYLWWNSILEALFLPRTWHGNLFGEI
ncbi:hypothetical protein Hanom_Chr11g01064001 [Helianthus anomalus]